MLKKVIYAALFVNDQEKALDFYTKAIGLEKRTDAPTPQGPRFLTVGVRGQDFDLVLWPGTAGTPKMIDGRPSTAAYTIETDDCRKTFEEMKGRGVSFEAPGVLEFPWGLVARFRDPDGNLLQIRQGR